jgi:Protein of unknown function (DUF4238)
LRGLVCCRNSMHTFIAMAPSIRHHYIPRYYLKRFENHEGAMWRRDQETGAITRGNNAHFGYKKHWNSLQNPPEGYAPDWAEKRLSEIDGFASAIVAQILSGVFPKDIRALACAISFMKNNQPRLRRELETNNAQDVAGWSNDHWLIARFQAALDDWQNYIPVHYSVQVIEESDKEARFLTSSNPLIDFKDKPTKFLPLSSRHCLVLSYDRQFADVSPSFQACDREIVAGINRRTVENSWQYVYSNKPDFSE